MSRVPAGVSTGGRFAAGTRSESSVALLIQPQQPASTDLAEMIDTSAATGGQPLVVMINDEVHDILQSGENCADCGRNVDACECLDRDVDSDTPLDDVDRLLQRAYRSAKDGKPNGDLIVQRLSAHAAAKVSRDAHPDACYLDLDWGPGGGLEPVAVADAFGDSGPIDPAAATGARTFTTGLRGDLLLSSGTMTAAPCGSGATYRLNLDKALGTEVW